jgi:hypothetical protein
VTPRAGCGPATRPRRGLAPAPSRRPGMVYIHPPMDRTHKLPHPTGLPVAGLHDQVRGHLFGASFKLHPARFTKGSVGCELCHCPVVPRTHALRSAARSPARAASTLVHNASKSSLAPVLPGLQLVLSQCALKAGQCVAPLAVACMPLVVDSSRNFVTGRFSSALVSFWPSGLWDSEVTMLSSSHRAGGASRIALPRGVQSESKFGSCARSSS